MARSAAFAVAIITACTTAASANTSLSVTFSAEAGNVTVCGEPTYAFEAATITLSTDKVVQVGGYYTQNEPAVSWVSDDDPDALYTLLMLDPDAFYCGKGTKQHWTVINIPGDALSKGDAINPFAHPGPPEMRFHRYLVLLHKQADGAITLSEEETASLQLRTLFDYQSFCAAHSLGLPVAQLAIDAQLDAFVVQYYAESGIDYCSFPESCSLVAS